MARTDELNIPVPGMPNPVPSFRVPRRKTGFEGNTRVMAVVAGGLACGLAVLMGVWALSSPRRGGVPVVQADSRPLRVKPENPGGMEVDGKDAAILTGAADGAARLAPPPEAPDVAALKRQAAAAQAVASQAAADKTAAEKSVAVASRVPAVQQAVIVAPVPLPAAKTAPPAAAPVVKPSAAATATVPASKAAAPVAVAGRAQVQLAAVATEDAAKTEWQRLERRMPDLLGGRKPAMIKAEHDGRTIWRVRTGGFADATDAAQFCEKVRTKGAGCTVASF